MRTSRTNLSEKRKKTIFNEFSLLVPYGPIPHFHFAEFEIYPYLWGDQIIELAFLDNFQAIASAEFMLQTGTMGPPVDFLKKYVQFTSLRGNHAEALELTNVISSLLSNRARDFRKNYLSIFGLGWLADKAIFEGVNCFKDYVEIRGGFPCSTCCLQPETVTL